jgi:prepilin-type N-terminal cleavage/methylation domain-containing protein
VIVRFRLGGGQRPAAQAGFTMIELLVVMSILGILAAVVSMSMVGLNAAAQHRADDSELMTVQSAMNFMLTDQGVDPDLACSLYTGGAGGATDMALFPSPQAFATSAGNGGQASHHPVQLWPHYLHERTTHRHYVCTGSGTVVPS